MTCQNGTRGSALHALGAAPAVREQQPISLPPLRLLMEAVVQRNPAAKTEAPIEPLPAQVHIQKHIDSGDYARWAKWARKLKTGP